MNSILVIAELNDKRSVALHNACRLAKAIHASLHVVFFCFERIREAPGDANELKSMILNRVDDIAKERLAAIIDAELSYGYEVIWDKRVDVWIQDHVNRYKPVAVVKTVHHSEGGGYTPTDWYLLRECPVPVLLVCAEKHRTKTAVMAAVDLGTKSVVKQQLNRNILNKARLLAETHGGPLYICYSPPVSQLLKDLGVQFTDEVEQAACKQLQSTMDELATTYAVPKEHILIRAGEPHKVIPSTAARLKVAVVVMGTVGRTGLPGIVIGNTAEKTLTYLKTDVLALKP